MRRICFVLLFIAGGALACGEESASPEEESVSAACLDSMEEAAAEPDSEKADPLIVASLDACQSPDEWLEALRENPAAMGLKDASFVGELDLEVACDGNEQTEVCSKR